MENFFNKAPILLFDYRRVMLSFSLRWYAIPRDQKGLWSILIHTAAVKAFNQAPTKQFKCSDTPLSLSTTKMICKKPNLQYSS